VLLRAIDLDGIPAAIEDAAPRVVDARDLSNGLRLFAGRRAWRALSSRLPEPPTGGRETELFFYGSGDFHHVTAALVARHAGPLTVLHVDNHPDWVTFPRGTNCGSWVNRALDLPGVARVVTVGPASGDLVRPQLSFANLTAVEDDRIRLYPWSHPPSRVAGRFRDCPSWTVRGGHLHWRALAGLGEGEAAGLVADAIATRDVYVTIDKDALSPRDAATNWEQGGMGLAMFAAILERVAARHRIVGADVCGDWSVPRMRDPVRWFISRTDRADGSPPADHRAVNGRTNLALLGLFARLFG
jgi:arginase family enzyme